MWHPAGSDYAIRETAEIITRHYLRYGRKQEIRSLEIHERAQNLTAQQAARLAELRKPNAEVSHDQNGE
jgi:hypothetical protein